MTILVTPTTDPDVTGSAVFDSTEDHTTVGLSRLIERWRADKNPNLAALATSYLDEIQDLENNIWFVLYGRMLEYAEGEQLNILGRIVGQAREGLDDDRYRARIGVRIRINQSIGTARDILEMLQLLTEATFHYVEGVIASFAVYFDAPPEDAGIGRELPGLVAETRAAGVGGLVSFPVDRLTGRGAFFGSSYNPTLNSARGFSSSYDLAAPFVGGLWSHAARS